LRDDALLVVIMVTDEDDCSAPPTTDLYDPAKVPQYGALLSYRCTQYGIACNGQLPPYAASAGDLTNCQGATVAQGGKLYEVSRYIDLFTKPKSQGGLKERPENVILSVMAGPKTPVSTLLANPNPKPPGPYVACPGPVDGTTCAVVLQHSCLAMTDPAFSADPAVRIQQVVESVTLHNAYRICDLVETNTVDPFTGIVLLLQSRLQ
jgi:hypothetical protein